MPRPNVVTETKISSKSGDFSSVAGSFVAFRDFEERSIGFRSRDFIYRHRLVATARIGVLDQEIDAQIGRVPVLVRNNDLFTAAIGDGLRLSDSVG